MQDNDDLESSESSTASQTAAPDRSSYSTRSSSGDTANGAQIEFDPNSPLSRLGIAPGELLTNAIQRVRMVIGFVGLFYTILVAVTVVLAIVLLLPDLFWAMDRSSPILMNTARIFIALVAFAAGLCALAVGLIHVRINESMQADEIMIDDIRDQILIQLQAAKYNLEELTERFKLPKEAPAAGALEYMEIAKRIGPLVSLLLNKERSILTLGVEGLKFFQLVKKVLNK